VQPDHGCGRCALGLEHDRLGGLMLSILHRVEPLTPGSTKSWSLCMATDDRQRDAIARAATAIADADALLVTAGAGMGVDSGLPTSAAPAVSGASTPASANSEYRSRRWHSRAGSATTPPWPGRSTASGRRSIDARGRIQGSTHCGAGGLRVRSASSSIRRTSTVSFSARVRYGLRTRVPRQHPSPAVHRTVLAGDLAGRGERLRRR
jgi:hypothetical protein